MFASPKLKVIHVVPSLSTRTGGTAFATVGMAAAIKRQGCEVSILCTDQSVSAQSKVASLSISNEDLPAGAGQLPIVFAPVKAIQRWSYAPSISQILRERFSDVDLVHIHSLYLYPQLASWKFARTLEIPYILSPHGALDPYLRKKGTLQKAAANLMWQRRMLDGASFLHLTTDDERRLIADMHLRAPARVIPIGTDLTAFRQMPSRDIFRSQFLDGFDGPLIVNHGRISEKKGLDTLIEATELVREVHPNVQLALVGPDDEQIGDRLRALAYKLGVTVTFVRELKGAELLGALSAADVWVLPSHTENFGLAVAEAMAARLPVVTTHHVNIAPDAARAGALVVSKNDPASFASAISALLSDAELRYRTGTTANAYVQRYDWNSISSQYIAMYSDAIERNSDCRQQRRGQ